MFRALFIAAKFCVQPTFKQSFIFCYVNMLDLIELDGNSENIFLTYETEFVLFLAVLGNSFLQNDIFLHATMKQTK